MTEISGFSAAGSPNCLRRYAFNPGNKETAGARWMDVTRSFVRLAPRFAAMSSISGEKERKKRDRERNIIKENPGRGTVFRSILSKSRR